MKKRELAREVGVSERSVSAYEKGDQEPSDDTLQKIADVLRFPARFFDGADPEELKPDDASFRAMSKMTAKQKDSALGAGEVALLLSDWIESRFELPEVDVPDLGREVGDISEAFPSFLVNGELDYPSTRSMSTPEAAAEILRTHWGLGDLSIKNMVALLESKGVRVFSLAIDAKEVDAFSMWHGKRPFVFLNTYKSAEHCRFDAAHELGHLVLHQHGQPQGPALEREANAFASAFLMPLRSVLAHAPKTPTLQSLIRYKKHWLVSVAALNYRLHAVQLTSDWTYRNLCIQIAKAGYRTSEPAGIQHEKSLVLGKVFAALREDGVTKSQIASQLAIDSQEIDELTFGLMLNALKGGRVATAASVGRERPSLRVVK